MTIEFTQLKFAKKLIEHLLIAMSQAQKDEAVIAEFTAEEISTIHSLLHSWSMLICFLLDSYDASVEYEFNEYVEFGSLWRTSMEQLTAATKFMRRYIDRLDDMPRPIYSIGLSFMTINDILTENTAIEHLLLSLARTEHNLKIATSQEDTNGDA